MSVVSIEIQKMLATFPLPICTLISEYAGNIECDHKKFTQEDQVLEKREKKIAEFKCQLIQTFSCMIGFTIGFLIAYQYNPAIKENIINSGSTLKGVVLKNFFMGGIAFFSGIKAGELLKKNGYIDKAQNYLNKSLFSPRH